jgi:hypothetical protein
MNRLPLARRATVTLSATGLALLAGVLAAPAASAAPGSAHGGPDAFVQLEHGRQPVFFCDEDRPNQRHAICLTLGGPRF